MNAVPTRKPKKQKSFAARLIGGGVVLTLALLPASIEGAAADELNVAADEAQFVTLINELRSSVGAPPLTVSVELVQVARPWTLKMKAAGEISHNPDLAKQVKANWRKLGENVGVGPTVEMLQEAFVKSPGHYRNLVDPAFDSVGITIEYDGDIFYVTEQFMDINDGVKAPGTPTAVPKASSAAPNELALKPPAKKAVKKKVVKKTTAK